jgi:hypothetical protein
MPTGIGAGIAGLVFENSKGERTPPVYDNLYSVHFNGTDQSLQNLTTAPLLGNSGTGDWSVSFWVKADTMSGIGRS